MESNFNKKFQFTNENYQLPAVDLFYSTENQDYQPLHVIKKILNYVKSKLNHYRIEEWSRHTRQRNVAQQIVFYIKNNSEFVTQAWCKFFECLSSYPDLIPRNIDDKVFSVHLCEAPGAFVNSLNHYLKLHHPEVEFIWRATTLNPYYSGNSISSTILDDRFILHTLPNWFFGENYDGDLMNVENIKSLIEYCKSIGDVNLITSDGSIDCMEKPDHQEEYVSKLHVAEFITSLSILSDKGSMLIKFFTFFETTTVSMLYVLNCCFEKVHIFKPATSKEGNSEVYVIALYYHKNRMTEDHVERILMNFQNEKLSMLPLNTIPQNFLNQVTKAAQYFMNQQVSVIENNIKAFQQYDKREHDRIKSMKHQMVEEYVRLYQFRPIEEHQKILHGFVFNTDMNLNERVHRGSHFDRITFHDLEKNDQIQILYDRLKEFYDSHHNQQHSVLLKSFKLNIDKTPSQFINLIHGRSIDKVMSSKFILVSVFKYFLEVIDFLEKQETAQKEELLDKTDLKINENGIVINSENFRLVTNYHTYEKNIILKILSHILEANPETLKIEDLLLFTQLLVSIILYLALFVYEEVSFDENKIKFKSLRSHYVENLTYLIKILSKEYSLGILSICNTKFLFTFNNDFYKSIISYNNHICLQLCTSYLNTV